MRTVPGARLATAAALSGAMAATAVTAFRTQHALESYGYRFDTPDRSIVISGDTNPTQAPIDACLARLAAHGKRQARS